MKLTLGMKIILDRGASVKKTRLIILLFTLILALCMLSACRGKKKDAETNKEKESVEQQIIKDSDSDEEEDDAQKETVLPEDNLKDKGTTDKTDSKKPANDVTKTEENDKSHVNLNDSDKKEDSNVVDDSDTEEEGSSRSPIVLPGVSLD